MGTIAVSTYELHKSFGDSSNHLFIANTVTIHDQHGILHAKWSAASTIEFDPNDEDTVEVLEAIFD